jgi:diguanylate cyclase (GGDEF)-like protein/PAS domain S-box-containing protein
MNTATVVLMLALGSFVYGLLLIALRFRGTSRHEVPFWIAAKFLQAAGSLMFFHRAAAFNGLTVIAKVTLLIGCAYEAWAVRILSGKDVGRRTHVLVSLGIIAVGSLTVSVPSPFESGVFFLLQSIFYFLPSIFLVHKHKAASFLQQVLGVFYFAAGLVFLTAAALCLIFPSFAMSLSGDTAAVIPITSYSIFLVSSYILLMIVKEKSDQEITQIQDSLEKSRIQFQRVVETAIEGIWVFDKDFRLTFANEQIASVLGYTVEEMLGRTYSSFIPEEYRYVSDLQESLRRSGKDSVYECCLLRKDGKEHWFLVSAKAILDDFGRFEGSFAMLTDINERRIIELALEETNRQLIELSNTDSLTGIANRRCFDAVLEREYLRLRRSKSKLSIIMFDIDHFKAYNDQYGHVMGDVCLRRIGGVLKNCIRESVDLAARYGGEEFACILPDTDLGEAVKVAERIQEEIRELKIEHKTSPVSQYITASFGVTAVEYSPKLSLEEIVDTADKLMYKAKASGRNRIEFAARSEASAAEG